MKLKENTSLGRLTFDTDICDPYTNAELTIGLKLGFRPINPTNGAPKGSYPEAGGRLRRISAWNANRWRAWLQTFLWTAQRYWNGRFWLINNQNAFSYTHGTTTYVPNVKCKLELEAETVLPGSPGKFHYVIDVVRLDESETFFRAKANLFSDQSSRAATLDYDSRRNPIVQASHVHEIGHLLGLNHVDIGKPHCPAGGNTNATVCYGVQDSDKNSVMGIGMYIRHEHAFPWRRALVALTGKGNFKSALDWPPSSIQVYPRTAEEVAAGKQLTSRPIR